MKKGTYVLIIFIVFFFLLVATIVSFVYYQIGRPPTVKAHSYLEIKLSGELQERHMPSFPMDFFMGEPLSMHDIWMNIRKAKVDKRIQCIVLRLGHLGCDWGKIEEIREAILDFRKSEKKTYAYIDEAPDFDKEYFLATACDKIILHPLGWLGINGIGGYVPFFKNTLDKLGIKAEFEHVEEYKTAYNMFTEEKFTPAHKRMMESIYGSLFSQYVKRVAEARGKTEEEIKELIDQGFYHGESALKAGLVDDLLFQDELEQLINEEGKKLYRITHERYKKIRISSSGLNRGKKVALIYGQGLIHSGESLSQTMGGATVSRWIRMARKDKSIAAVVFRVDSPGGSAVASDVIWREVFLTQKEKPIVVSMSDVAGSGGYWVSMAAHKIIAQPQTLTGSIGVISGKFNMSNLYEKLGITAEKLTYGKRADFFSTFRSFTPEERREIKNEILWIYDQFLAKVAEGRNMSKEEVDEIGKGRVWTGIQAKKQGLVDEIGGLSRALELAKEMADIPAERSVKLVIWPKRVSFLSALFGRGQARSKLNFKPDLQKILSTLEFMEQERALAVMPLWLTPK
ncbi:MAG: signal peptide peptidase SppA [Candidatus Aminicenantes bacterium]|nr:MAG: signal peptide peptidase SppA [Candidatus Aminicenantes bacterium]